MEGYKFIKPGKVEEKKLKVMNMMLKERIFLPITSIDVCNLAYRLPKLCLN